MVGIDTAISAGVTLVGKVFDRLFPDPAQRDAAELALKTLEQDGSLKLLMIESDLIKGQLAINETEAAHESIFVAGWRPAVGWVCVAGFGCKFVFFPLATWVVTLFGASLTPPALDVSELTVLLGGLLGLSGLRTFEKTTSARAMVVGH